MTPRCFLALGGIGPRSTGGEIFSNMKAGIVHPLFVELRHSWIFAEYLSDEPFVTAISPSRLTQTTLYIISN
jgi:hypothetical protein